MTKEEIAREIAQDAIDDIEFLTVVEHPYTEDLSDQDLIEIHNLTLGFRAVAK